MNFFYTRVISTHTHTQAVHIYMIIPYIKKSTKIPFKEKYQLRKLMLQQYEVRPYRRNHFYVNNAHHRGKSHGKVSI